MIKGNWSLSSEIRSNERKQQQKIQSRQKHTTKIEKVKDLDPIRLHWRIKRLEEDPDKSERDLKYLKGLKEDWDFIQKNKLHQEKLVPFLEKLSQQQRQKEIENSKLWGLKSVYFNPELNPLGKVPDIEKLTPKPTRPLPNATTPLKHSLKFNYEKDPIIDEMNIAMPEGEAPRFYKSVQNTEKPREIKSEKKGEKEGEITTTTTTTKESLISQNSHDGGPELVDDDEVSSDLDSGDDEDVFVTKRQKFE